MNFFPAWLVAVPVAILIAYIVWKAWPKIPEEEYDTRLAELMADMRNRGLTDEEQREEMAFRYAMARLREAASAAVLKRPGDHAEIVSDLIAIESKRIALTNRSLGRRFVAVCKATPLSDILYADALKAVHGLPITIVRSKPTSVDIAAVTTVRD